MKIAVLTVTARQVEGDTFWVNIMKAHKDPNVLYKFLRENSLPQTETIGNIPCVLEYGVIEDVELEGVEDK